MHELAPGLWHWKAPHPDWRPGEPWFPRLRPRLDLPVEHVLATHGDPVDRAALERVLS